MRFELKQHLTCPRLIDFQLMKDEPMAGQLHPYAYINLGDKAAEAHKLLSHSTTANHLVWRRDII